MKEANNKKAVGDAPLLEQHYAHRWQAAEQPSLRAVPGDMRTLVMVRGLFGSWIPNHFKRPLQHFARNGWSVVVGHTKAADTMAVNALRLGRQMDALIAAGRRPVFLTHSKGGLETLLALAAHENRAAATAGFIGVQVPRAGAPYLESLFSSVHAASRRGADRWREPLEAALLTLCGAKAACAELRTDLVRETSAVLNSQTWPFARLMVATHAQRATRSLEMRHARLEQIYPGALHDGVFRTADQLWPGAHQLTLADIDHAQPSVGGLGFAHDRFWAALLAVLLQDLA